MKVLKCPYCHSEAKLEDNIKIYKSRSYGFSYICSNYPKCDSYVGVHNKTNKPLGRMANAELRKSRNEAHNFFDPLWQNEIIPRKKMYKWLADKLGLKREECHIGMFDVELCNKVVNIMKQNPKIKINPTKGD